MDEAEVERNFVAEANVYFKQLCSAEAMVNTVQTGQSTARQRGTGSPQRDSAERATHSATARDEQLQRDSAERAALSMTVPIQLPIQGVARKLDWTGLDCCHPFGGWPEN